MNKETVGVLIIIAIAVAGFVSFAIIDETREDGAPGPDEDLLNGGADDNRADDNELPDTGDLGYVRSHFTVVEQGVYPGPEEEYTIFIEVWIRGENEANIDLRMEFKVEEEDRAMEEPSVLIYNNERRTAYSYVSEDVSDRGWEKMENVEIDEVPDINTHLGDFEKFVLLGREVGENEVRDVRDLVDYNEEVIEELTVEFHNIGRDIEDFMFEPPEDAEVLPR